MAWTTPRTWVTAEVVTASVFNTHIRDNLEDLFDRAHTKPNLTWLATSNEPPAVDPATPVFRNTHPLLNFDDATKEYALFSGVLAPTYTNGGLTVELHWMAATATTNAVKWDVDIDAIASEGHDIDRTTWSPVQTVTDTCASASGELIMSTLTYTHGAAMGGLLGGDMCRVRVARDGSASGDTMSGDAQLYKVVLRET